MDGSIAAIRSATISRRAWRFVASSTCSTAMKSAMTQPAHPLPALETVRGECLRRAPAVEDDVANDAGIAHRDREALPDDRIVVAGGIADQHDTVDVGLVGPRVVAGVGGTRAGRLRRPQLLAGVVRGEVARGKEPLGAVGAGETVLAGQPGHQVGPRPATTLVEHDEEDVALADDHVMIGRHTVETVHEQAGDVPDRRLVLEADTGLPANARGPPVRTDDQGG